MPNHLSAVQRQRTNERDQRRNRRYKQQLKKVRKAVLSAGSKKEAEVQLKQYYSLTDKMVVKGILNANKAANQKSKITATVSQIS